jgi:hypothetical protein
MAFLRAHQFGQQIAFDRLADEGALGGGADGDHPGSDEGHHQQKTEDRPQAAQPGGAAIGNDKTEDGEKADHRQDRPLDQDAKSLGQPECQGRSKAGPRRAVALGGVEPGKSSLGSHAAGQQNRVGLRLMGLADQNQGGRQQGAADQGCRGADQAAA